MKLILPILLFITIQTTFAQRTIHAWQEVVNRNSSAFEYEDRMQIPSTYRVLDLDLNTLKQELKAAPMELTTQKSSVIISLPIMPSGFMNFEIFESPVMSEKLAAKFPSIKSYVGYGVENNAYSARLDYSEKGLHASIMSPDGRIFIDPEELTSNYICFRTKDLVTDGEAPTLSCGYQPDANGSSYEATDDLAHVDAYSKSAAPMPLRVYRLALACTGEYAQAKGGTMNSVMASFNTAMNRVNQVFQMEVGVKAVLIDNNDQLIFLDPITDPYENPTLGTGLLGQNLPAFIGAGIGVDEYDLGHVFTIGCSDVGGVVSGRTCDDTGKMRGVTCHYTSSIEAIVLDVMSHEVGHQFSVGHSWNNCPSSIEQLSSANAYEPGSGSTIMSYAGSCGEQNIQFGSNTYYNIGSLEDFIFYSREGNGACGVEEPTSNNEPVVEIPIESGFFIPISTPFELDAIASDEDGDAITYCWEQFDLGPVSQLGFPLLNAPIFRSFPPNSNSGRMFPKLSSVLSNNMDETEVLPTYSRDLTFRCTVRDNDPIAGGTVWDEVSFKATENAGPFRMTYPSAFGLEFEVGQYVEVTWNVANTDGGQVDCQLVDITLSTNGGNQFDIPLLENTPNDGTAFVVIPDNVASSCRMKIKGSDNIFFDVSNSNFEIVPATTPGYALGVSPEVQQACLPTSSTVNLSMSSLLGYDSLVTFEILSGLPDGAIATFSANPALPTENSTLTIDLNDVTESGTYEVLIQASAASTDTLLRTIFLDVVSNDYSSIAIEEPSEGLTGTTTLPQFSWTGADAATSYTIEIATSPIFGNTVIDMATGVTETTYSPAVTLDESTPYYWRVIPENICGIGNPIQASSFHTLSFSCALENSVDTPINISGSGTPTLESKINVLADGEINDINVPVIKGNHEFFSDLKATLTSPAGTSVVLFSGKCLNYNGGFSFGLDDEAPTSFQCPPGNGVSYRPSSALSVFNGENTKGVWTLKIEDSVGGSGGKLDDWQLEFCASVNTTPPVLVNNIEMPLNPNSGRFLANEFLLTEDPNNEEWELVYTVVNTPKKGTLSLEGVDLSVGGEFTQSDIKWGRVRYTHNGIDGLDNDTFRFTVRDNEGGWIGTPTFNLLIDPDVVVSIAEIQESNSVKLFPNPASDQVEISFSDVNATETILSILNVKGQVLRQERLNIENDIVRLDVSSLASGVYFVECRLSKNVLYKKMIVE